MSDQPHPHWLQRARAAHDRRVDDRRKRLECVADLALLEASVKATDVVEQASGDVVCELVVADNCVPAPIVWLLGRHDLSIDPDATATRGDPTHTVVVAR